MTSFSQGLFQLVKEEHNLLARTVRNRNPAEVLNPRFVIEPLNARDDLDGGQLENPE